MLGLKSAEKIEIGNGLKKLTYKKRENQKFN